MKQEKIYKRKNFIKCKNCLEDKDILDVIKEAEREGYLKGLKETAVKMDDLMAADIKEGKVDWLIKQTELNIIKKIDKKWDEIKEDLYQPYCEKDEQMNNGLIKSFNKFLKELIDEEK